MDHPQAGDLLVWGTQYIHIFMGWSMDILPGGQRHYYVWSPMSPGRLIQLTLYDDREFDGAFWTRCIRMPKGGIDG